LCLIKFELGPHDEVLPILSESLELLVHFNNRLLIHCELSTDSRVHSI
jgi:hypothetical protein